MFIRMEWIPPIVRRRWREQPSLDNGERIRLGESKDERAARNRLRPRSGSVQSSVRALDAEIAREQESDRVLGRRR